MVAGSKFYLDPELCARRIVNCTHNADIEFCKVFFNLNSKTSILLKHICRLFGS